MRKFNVLFIAALISGSAVAQDRPIHEVYSMMVFNFTKYVQWPDHTATGEFVLFIDKSKSGEFEEVKNKVKGKWTLIITDKNGLGEKGSGINFKTIDNKLKFELNQKAIDASNLKVSGALSSMAILI